MALRLINQRLWCQCKVDCDLGIITDPSHRNAANIFVLQSRWCCICKAWMQTLTSVELPQLLHAIDLIYLFTLQGFEPLDLFWFTIPEFEPSTTGFILIHSTGIRTFNPWVYLVNPTGILTFNPRPLRRHCNGQESISKSANGWVLYESLIAIWGNQINPGVEGSNPGRVNQDKPRGWRFEFRYGEPK